MSESIPRRKKCELENCEETFELTEAAPHKKFCCAEHRMMWHSQRRQEAMRALRAKEKAGAEE